MSINSKTVKSSKISRAAVFALALMLLNCLVFLGCGKQEVSKKQAQKDAEQIAALRASKAGKPSVLAKKVEKALTAEVKSEAAPKIVATKLTSEEVQQALKAQEKAPKAAARKALNLPKVSENVTLDRVKSETSEALAVADAFLQQQEKKYYNKIDSELQQFSARVEKLKTRAETAAQGAKEKVSKQLTELRNQMVVTGSQLGDFNKKSESELGQLSKELTQLLSVLESKEAKLDLDTTKDTKGVVAKRES